ncbi:MAG: co-chaperone GroES, partial [Clostridia bacterium]|nr:co-chaperone GroES [Clostridia bacterium]
MNVKPLFDKVVVESLEMEEKTQSGFYLPTASQEKQQMAKFIAVG